MSSYCDDNVPYLVRIARLCDRPIALHVTYGHVAGLAAKVRVQACRPERPSDRT
jgi:hypothetical protein